MFDKINQAIHTVSCQRESWPRAPHRVCCGKAEFPVTTTYTAQTITLSRTPRFDQATGRLTDSLRVSAGSFVGQGPSELVVYAEERASARTLSVGDIALATRLYAACVDQCTRWGLDIACIRIAVWGGNVANAYRQAAECTWLRWTGSAWEAERGYAPRRPFGNGPTSRATVVVSEDTYKALGVKVSGARSETLRVVEGVAVKAVTLPLTGLREASLPAPKFTITVRESTMSHSRTYTSDAKTLLAAKREAGEYLKGCLKGEGFVSVYAAGSEPSEALYIKRA